MSEKKSEESWLPLSEDFSTLAIHAGYSPGEEGYYAAVPSISMSTTYQLEVPAINRGFEYSRTSNPSRHVLEKRLAALEEAKHGVCFASGLSAISAIMSLLENGDHVICSDDIYGGTNRLWRESISRNNLEVEILDLSDIQNLISSLKPKTKMIFLESPANPTLKVFDISLISKTAHKYSESILIAVDNTVLTSFFQKPLDFGADLVHYSLSKYANGHADVIMGAVITNNESLAGKLCYYQNAFGAVPSPFDCYLVTRGLKTLHLRMPALMESSMKVATFLESHPKVKSVNHPGLSSHPQHKLALKQASGHSSLLSFTIIDTGSSMKFLGSLRLFCNAASFGGCESLAEIPAFFTHISIPLEQRLKVGITDNFVRLSVGLESGKDLIKDLSQALEKC